MSLDLETTYYVTNLKQMTDFAWYRRSGIRVNVAARDINVVPEYQLAVVPSTWYQLTVTSWTLRAEVTTRSC